MKHKANADPNLVNKYAKKRIIENTEKDDNRQSKSQKTNKISNEVKLVKSKDKQPTLDFFGIKAPTANKEENFPLLNTSLKVKIMSWNVNGIRSVIKKGDLQDFIHKEKPDILCLNETKIDQVTLRKERIEYIFNKDYLTYWNFSDIKKGYSGVAIFSKFKPQKVNYGIGIPEYDQEGRVITAEFDTFVLIAVYVPNSGQERLEYRTTKWDVVFREYIIKKKNETKKSVIVTGDMNVCHDELDLYNYEKIGDVPPFTKAERDNFDLLLKEGFIDIYRELNKDKREYSWYGNDKDKLLNQGYRIDYFLVDEKIKSSITSADIYKKYIGSDHVPIGIEFDLKI